jgi:hypothetical protein
MSKGVKHLIQCRCILPTLKSKKDPPLHSFVVFSIENEDATLVEKHTNCNNCGILHRVTGHCQSEILHNFEGTASSITIEDIRLFIPESIIKLLDSYNCELADFEFVKFMLDNSTKDFIVLSHEFNDGRKTGKILKHKGDGTFEIEPFSRSEVIE